MWRWSGLVGRAELSLKMSVTKMAIITWHSPADNRGDHQVLYHFTKGKCVERIGGTLVHPDSQPS